jgi:hypothetical protein
MDYYRLREGLTRKGRPAAFTLTAVLSPCEGLPCEEFAALVVTAISSFSTAGMGIIKIQQYPVVLPQLATTP